MLWLFFYYHIINQLNIIKMNKVAILNGEKMILPKYAKYGGMYGIFTTEGFVTWGGDNAQDLQIEEIKYDGFFQINTDDEFSKLPYPIFN
jgi:hypothetical protein